MNLLKKTWNNLFGNFMWLYFVVGIINLVGFFVPLLQFFMIVCFLYGVQQFSKIKKINELDTMIIIYFTYIIINSIVIDYPNHLKFLVQAFIFQICPLMCYFIGRTNELSVEAILKKMLVPLTIAMVLGVYFHLEQPGWYNAMKWTTIYDRYGNNITDYGVIEHMRLSSIWNSSYYIGFATLFFSVYLLYAISFRPLKQKEKLLYVALIVLSVFVLIYANHRTTILGFIIAYLYCFIRGRNKSIHLYFLLGGVIIAFIFVTIMLSSSEYTEYISLRFQSVTTEGGIQERLEHTGGEQVLNTVLGNGYGRYSLRAREYGGWAIIDSEYQKQLGELGVIGFTLFVVILLIGLAKSVNKRNDAGLELCIMLFYVEAFIGASALSVDSEYSFIFWYVLGKISQKSVASPKISYANLRLVNNRI